MTDRNEILTENIRRVMLRKRKKQAELARCMEVPRQIVYKMLSGARTIQAVELKMIADFLEVPMESLMEDQEGQKEDAFLKLAQQAKTQAAQEGLSTVSQLADMVLLQKEYLCAGRKTEV